MRRSAINTLARSIESALMNIASRAMTDDELRQSALIVAPHADDETLGCGGTIMKKIAARADIHVVFVTDSGGSHKSLPKEELARRRVDEARDACEVLGVPNENITLLALTDGAMERHEQEATDRFAALLEQYKPAQVFVPYRFDNHPDHLATNRAVVAAVHRTTAPRVLMEYPIWFWEFWPWMNLPENYPHRTRRTIKRAVLSPLRAMRDFRIAVDIKDVLERKRAALAKHATQMAPQAENWDTLAMVSEGEFLARLLTDREIFARREIRP